MFLLLNSNSCSTTDLDLWLNHNKPGVEVSGGRPISSVFGEKKKKEILINQINNISPYVFLFCCYSYISRLM